MEDATIKTPDQQLYQQGEFPSMIDTDDLVFEMGLQRVGNMNKEKVLKAVTKRLTVLEGALKEAGTGKVAAEVKTEALGKSNKLFDDNNKKLDAALVNTRQELAKVKEELAKVKAEFNNIVTDKTNLARQLTNLTSDKANLAAQLTSTKEELTIVTNDKECLTSQLKLKTGKSKKKKEAQIMANPIQIKRGALADIPTLNAGEFGFTTDTKQIYVGDGVANIEMATVDQVAAVVINDLSDVDTTGAVTDYVLKKNGSGWLAAPSVTASGAVGTTFYMDDVEILGVDTDNANEVNTLQKTPITTTEVVDTISVANNTVYGEAYLYDTALGGTTIDAGEWCFCTYASVSSLLGGRVSSITRNIYLAVVDASTITTTGTGTSRTATAAAGTPFVAGDASATITDSGYLQTPQGLYQITGYTSATVVTIATPTDYTNEVTQAFSTWKMQFGSSTGAITSKDTAYQSFRIRSVQSEISVAVTDKLAEIVFGVGNNTTDIYFTHNGEDHYSHFRSPLVTRHNDLPGLQGGGAAERYHLTSAQHTVATQEADTTLSGYLSTTDWDTFNEKASTPTVYVKTTSATLLTAEVAGPNTIHNDGAGGEVIMTWLALVTGQEAMFYVNDAQYLQIKAPAATTIRFGAVTTAAAGYVRSNVVGNWIRIKAMPDGLVVFGVGGDWTFDEQVK